MTTQVIWRTNPYTGKEVWTYGNYGGPGWCGDEFVPPGTKAEFKLDGKNRLDEIFKTHDQAYDSAADALAASGKTQADQQKEALDILKADEAMLTSIDHMLRDAVTNGETLGPDLVRAAVEAQKVFEAKRLYDMAHLVANQPGLGIDGDPFTGLPSPSDNDALITELQIRFTTAKTIDPIILDLNGDGVQTSKLSKSLSAGVHFNLDAKGLAENTGWVPLQRCLSR